MLHGAFPDFDERVNVQLGRKVSRTGHRVEEGSCLFMGCLVALGKPTLPFEMDLQQVTI